MINNETISLGKDSNEFPVYISKPKGTPKAGLIVIHEVWGLSDHIKETADRFAKEGYLVLAPNLITDTDIQEKSGTLNIDLFNPEKSSEAQPKLRELMAPMLEPGFGENILRKVRVCFDYLYDQPELKQNIVVVGFCFGGTYSFGLAEAEPRLGASVPFYGHSSNDQGKINNIKCPILAFYGDQDEGLMKTLPEVKEKMEKAKVDFTTQVYAGAGHAFFNNTNPFTYKPEIAQYAWTKTLEFLDKNI